MSTIVIRIDSNVEGIGREVTRQLEGLLENLCGEPGTTTINATTNEDGVTAVLWDTITEEPAA